MPAGSVLFYLGSVWHGGGANTTDRARLGVILEYVASWLRPQENHFLAVPRAVAAQLPETLQELLGYNIYPPFMGYVDGRHPRRSLDRGRVLTSWATPSSTSCTGHVATITYNRPDALNAVNGELRRDLNAAFARFRDEEEAWVGIVTGAGRAFCAGADLRDGQGSTGRVRRHLLGEADAQFLRERLGDPQARHRGGERPLPRLRADPRDVVRLRPGQ